MVEDDQGLPPQHAALAQTEHGERDQEAWQRQVEIESELYQILEQKLRLSDREMVLRDELIKLQQAGKISPEPARINPDTEIDPETGKDPHGFTAEDHAQGRYRSHGLTYRDWNDPGTYD